MYKGGAVETLWEPLCYHMLTWYVPVTFNCVWFSLIQSLTDEHLKAKFMRTMHDGIPALSEAITSDMSSKCHLSINLIFLSACNKSWTQWPLTSGVERLTERHRPMTKSQQTGYCSLRSSASISPFNPSDWPTTFRFSRINLSAPSPPSFLQHNYCLFSTCHLCISTQLSLNF